VSELVSETVPALPVVKLPIELPFESVTAAVAPETVDPPTESRTTTVIAVELELDEEELVEEELELELADVGVVQDAQSAMPKARAATKVFVLLSMVSGATAFGKLILQV
jgi:hypothetical protein